MDCFKKGIEYSREVPHPHVGFVYGSYIRYPTVWPFYAEPISIEPLDFYRAGSREVSLEELISVVEAGNATLY